MKQLKKYLTTENIKRAIPYLGIVAFSWSSVHALADYLNSRSRNPSPRYEVSSYLIELFSAFIIGMLVNEVRIATWSIGSGRTKERRRMARILVPFITALVIPSVWVSVVANRYEFQGDILLGSLFPSLCVSSAIAAGLYDSLKAKREERKSKTAQTPKPLKQKTFFRKCRKCSFDTGPRKTERSAINALNAHKCK
jgi:hypothetical protein